MDESEHDAQLRRFDEVRQLLLAAAREAYDAAGMQGLCREGRVDLACEAIRAWSLESAGQVLPERDLAELREACLRAVASGALEASRS